MLGHICWSLCNQSGGRIGSFLLGFPPLKCAERKIDAFSPFKPLRGWANIPSKPFTMTRSSPPCKKQTKLSCSSSFLLFCPLLFLSYNISEMIRFKVKASCWPLTSSCCWSDCKERNWQHWHPPTDTQCCVNGSEITQSRELTTNQKKKINHYHFTGQQLQI